MVVSTEPRAPQVPALAPAVSHRRLVHSAPGAASADTGEPTGRRSEVGEAGTAQGLAGSSPAPTTATSMGRVTDPQGILSTVPGTGTMAGDEEER